MGGGVEKMGFRGVLEPRAILCIIHNMSKREKLLKEIENAPTNVRFEILERLLKESGFVLKSVKGSHHSFSNGKILITLPYHKPMKAYYVEAVLKVIKGD